MKIRNMIIVFLLGLVIGIIATNGYYMFTNKNVNSSVENNDSKTVLTDSDKLYPIVEKLLEYGNEIYDKKGYATYSKRKGAYFVSLSDMEKDFNYDISMFVDSKGNYCDVDATGVYFDVDKKMQKEYADGLNPIIVATNGCGGEED